MIVIAFVETNKILLSNGRMLKAENSGIVNLRLIFVRSFILEVGLACLHTVRAALVLAQFVLFSSSRGKGAILLQCRFGSPPNYVLLLLVLRFSLGQHAAIRIIPLLFEVMCDMVENGIRTRHERRVWTEMVVAVLQSACRDRDHFSWLAINQHGELHHNESDQEANGLKLAVIIYGKIANMTNPRIGRT